MKDLEHFQNPLLSIPSKKVDSAIRAVIDSFPECKGKGITSGLPEDVIAIIDAIKRYGKANIPVDYWFLDMDEFQGDKSLLKKYNDIVSNINRAYESGVKFCFAGPHGVGKSYICTCVLKRAVESGYSGLYVNLTDIVTVLTSGSPDKRYLATQILKTVDFLVIDEFDPRFMGSENASDLFGRILEPTLRARIQNKLPLLMCTNSPNVLNSFSGSLKQSISSLMNLVKIVPVLGGDYRSKLKENNAKS